MQQRPPALPQEILQRHPCPDHKIVRADSQSSAERPIQRQPDHSVISRMPLQVIAILRKDEKAFQFMIAIGSARPNMQRQIDLGICDFNVFVHILVMRSHCRQGAAYSGLIPSLSLPMSRLAISPSARAAAARQA